MIELWRKPNDRIRLIGLQFFFKYRLMKTGIFHLFVLCCLVSCKKQDDRQAYFPNWATATALRNDVSWVADTPVARLNGKGELIIDLGFHIPFKNTDERLSYHLPLLRGKYKIENQYVGFDGSENETPAMSYFWANGDLIYIADFVAKDTLNQCTIEQIDLKQKKVSGKFSAAVYIKHISSKMDTIRFTNGRFTLGF
jgi:hypothetical protein